MKLTKECHIIHAIQKCFSMNHFNMIHDICAENALIEIYRNKLMLMSDYQFSVVFKVKFLPACVVC